MKTIFSLAILLSCTILSFAQPNLAPVDYSRSKYVSGYDNELMGRALMQKQQAYEHYRGLLQNKVDETYNMFYSIHSQLNNDTDKKNLISDFDYFNNQMIPQIRGDFSNPNVYYSFVNWLNDYKSRISFKYSK